MKNFDQETIEGLNFVSLNDDLLNHINYLQTGGQYKLKEIQNVVYNNSGLNGYFEAIDELLDHFIYMNEDTNCSLKPEGIIDYIKKLNFLRYHFKEFVAK